MSSGVCCFDGCMDEARWVCVRSGKIVGYYCDRHLYVRVLENGSDYYRWFRIGDYKCKSVVEILYGEGGEATVDRVAYLMGMDKGEVLEIAVREGIKISLKRYSPSDKEYITYLNV